MSKDSVAIICDGDEPSHSLESSSKRRWTRYIWDTLDKDENERRFLFKLDAALLTFASLGYFIKYLDQTNINNAFVSGMKEDLSLYGNELNYMQTAWTVGYVIEFGHQYGYQPVVWSILTICLVNCKSATQLYILRFFIGLAESTFYPGMQYIIGSWYRKDELAKRSCIFHTSGAIATMFSGYLMAGTVNLNGRNGWAGWQWLFIMNGVISLPIAAAGFLFLPDVPETTRAFYLKQEEVCLSRKRMALEGRQQRQPYTRAKLYRILSSWHIYVLSVLYIAFNNGNSGAAPVFAQYLKASQRPKYSVAQINTYPTGTNAVQVVTTLAYAWASDSLLNGRRWPPILVGGSFGICAYISLAIWNIPDGWRWTCYYIMGFSGGLSGIIIAWAHEICAKDNEERAIVIASMNEMAYVFQAWLPLLVWQQVDAPQYRKGFITAAALSFLMIVIALLTELLSRREQKEKLAVLAEEIGHSARNSPRPA